MVKHYNADLVAKIREGIALEDSDKKVIRLWYMESHNMSIMEDCSDCYRDFFGPVYANTFKAIFDEEQAKKAKKKTKSKKDK